jgi:hypothetical protein
VKIQVTPNRWSCLPTAFAIALDVRTGMLIKWLGHDGSRVVRPGLPEPECYVGFHIQELIGYAWWLGSAVTPFEANPRSHVGGEAVRIEFQGGNAARMLTALHANSGVLTGQSVATGSHHAVAWDGSKIYNPTGAIQGLEDFAINTFWLISGRSR